MTIKTRHHVTSIRYALTVELGAAEAIPAVGDTFSLGDMGVVRVVRVVDDSRQHRRGSRERFITVETLETIGRLAAIS